MQIRLADVIPFYLRTVQSKGFFRRFQSEFAGRKLILCALEYESFQYNTQNSFDITVMGFD